MDKSQAESEDCRLLYVALTRAKDKVLISGHYTAKESKVSVTGWLKELLNAAGYDSNSIGSTDHTPDEVTLPCGQMMSIWTQIPVDEVPIPVSQPTGVIQPGETNLQPLYQPIIEPVEALVDDEETETPIWRVTGQDNQVLGQTIGKMVHKAIQRWRFPGDPGLANLLDSVAREAGVVEEAKRQYALQEAQQFLSRFSAHPLWQDIHHAAVRLHEVPYTMLRADGRTEVGYIDLLYRESEDSVGWVIVDFKTDTIQSEGELALLVDRYTRQARRYARAVRELLGPVDAVKLCFLDAGGQVVVIEV